MQPLFIKLLSSLHCWLMMTCLCSGLHGSSIVGFNPYIHSFHLERLGFLQWLPPQSDETGNQCFTLTPDKSTELGDQLVLCVVLLTATYIIKPNHCETTRILRTLLCLFLSPHPEVHCSVIPRTLQQYLE